jgi:alkyl-hydroperoxide reductase/thiol specific antioxidant family protein
LCREHAVQLRGEYAAIKSRGADVVLIGTGDLRYARAFVADEQIPFPVLVDDDALAANAASIRRAGLLGMFNPASFPGGIRAWRAGHRIGKPGPRVDQLGATFVVGPGAFVRYQHYDAHTADHALMPAIIAALP